MDIKEYIIKDEIFKIGVVYSVVGRKIKVKVFKNKNHPHLIYNGQITKNVGVGSYIKIEKGLITLIGKIEGEEVSEEVYLDKSYIKEEAKIKRILNVSLFGHYENGMFYQGIKELPLVGNECYALCEEDFRKLHSFFKKEDKVIELGKLSDDPSHVIKVSINKLFASHIGIFGNTGSGKSNTLAKIYTELFNAMRDISTFKENSTFIFVDFNGEYTGENILFNDKKVIKLNTRKKIKDIVDKDRYIIDSKILEDVEILSIILHATEKTQKPFLSKVVDEEYLKDSNKYPTSVNNTVRNIIEMSSPSATKEDIINFLNKILEFLDDGSKKNVKTLINNISIHLSQIANGAFRWDSVFDKKDGLDIWSTYIEPNLSKITFLSNINPLDNLKLKIFLEYYYLISISAINKEFISPLIHRVEKQFEVLKKVIDVKDRNLDKNIIVLSLRDVKLEMKKILPLIVCKHLYELQKGKNEENEKIETSLHIIIDEAHNILSEESQRESELWKDYRLETFEEIIKEGRKFGVFLTISSQRPYDISQTILSQLHNYFIHRLINNNDLNAVRKAVAYLDDVSFDTIPILTVGSCFFAGLATDIPIKVNIDLLDENKRPKSETIDLINTWDKNLEKD